MARPTTPISLTGAINEYIQGIVRSREVPHSRVLRAKIILKAAEGDSNNQPRLRSMQRDYWSLETTLDRGSCRFINQQQSKEIISSEPRTLSFPTAHQNATHLHC